MSNEITLSVTDSFTIDKNEFENESGHELNNKEWKKLVKIISEYVGEDSFIQWDEYRDMVKRHFFDMGELREHISEVKSN